MIPHPTAETGWTRYLYPIGKDVALSCIRYRAATSSLSETECEFIPLNKLHIYEPSTKAPGLGKALARTHSTIDPSYSV